MVTKPVVFRNLSDTVTPETILSSGEWFSGIIYLNKKMNNWIEFNLVNREKMCYILKDIDLNKEVQFEIFSYAKYSEGVQR